jgi:hypothetical protein
VEAFGRYRLGGEGSRKRALRVITAKTLTRAASSARPASYNWASDGADAFRYFAAAMREPRLSKPPRELARTSLAMTTSAGAASAILCFVTKRWPQQAKRTRIQFVVIGHFQTIGLAVPPAQCTRGRVSLAALARRLPQTAEFVVAGFARHRRLVGAPARTFFAAPTADESMTNPDFA